MALIKCRECGNEISSRAEQCPHCGAKTRFGASQKEQKQLSNTLIILLIICVIGTILFFSGITTMISDIKGYKDLWSYGYSYKPPFTDHEKAILLKTGIGIAMDIGSFVGIYNIKKSLKK